MAEDAKYHNRRMDKDMPERADQLAVIRGQKFMTVALARDNEPYLVTMNYGFSEPENCFYVHCATTGRKLDFLRRNPRVWGQVIEDRGYLTGKCNHSFRSVMFTARVEFVEAESDMLQAMDLLMTNLEPNPKRLKRLPPALRERTAVLRFRVESMTGKQNPAPPKGAEG